MTKLYRIYFALSNDSSKLRGEDLMTKEDIVKLLDQIKSEKVLKLIYVFIIEQL